MAKKKKGRNRFRRSSQKEKKAKSSSGTASKKSNSRVVKAPSRSKPLSSPPKKTVPPSTAEHDAALKKIHDRTALLAKQHLSPPNAEKKASVPKPASTTTVPAVDDIKKSEHDLAMQKIHDRTTALAKKHSAPSNAGKKASVPKPASATTVPAVDDIKKSEHALAMQKIHDRTAALAKKHSAPSNAGKKVAKESAAAEASKITRKKAEAEAAKKIADAAAAAEAAEKAAKKATELKASKAAKAAEAARTTAEDAAAAKEAKLAADAATAAEAAKIAAEEKKRKMETEAAMKKAADEEKKRAHDLAMQKIHQKTEALSTQHAASQQLQMAIEEEKQSTSPPDAKTNGAAGNNLSESDIKQARAKFEELDVDNSGTLKGPEMKKLADWVSKHCHKISPGEDIYGHRLDRLGKHLMEQLDVNKDGEVEFDEFVNWYTTTNNQTMELSQAERTSEEIEDIVGADVVEEDKASTDQSADHKKAKSPHARKHHGGKHHRGKNASKRHHEAQHKEHRHQGKSTPVPEQAQAATAVEQQIVVASAPEKAGADSKSTENCKDPYAAVSHFWESHQKKHMELVLKGQQNLETLKAKIEARTIARIQLLHKESQNVLAAAQEHLERVRASKVDGGSDVLDGAEKFYLGQISEVTGLLAKLEGKIDRIKKGQWLRSMGSASPVSNLKSPFGSLVFEKEVVAS